MANIAIKSEKLTPFGVFFSKMQQFVKFRLQALICNRLNPWHEVKEGREVYKIEKCAFSQKHTPLITKIQVYIFVVCCCLI
ncbi:MAG: hypothetical protein ACI4UW_00655, partial [Muribaculaceae bacterium]